VSVSNDIAELESYKKALSKELDSLKKEIEISKYDVSRIKELDLKIFETVSELSTKEKELDNTINDIDFNNSKLSEIQNNIETLNKDLSLIKKEVFTADKNKIELENKIKDIEGVLSDRKMFLDKVNEDASSIEKRVRALEDKEQLLKKDVSVFNERVKKAGDSISKKQSELFDINEDVLLALSNKKDLLAEISNLSKDK
jgi:chromosome segregation ATPase